MKSAPRYAPYLILAAAVLIFYRHVLFDSNYTFPWDFRTVHVPLAQIMADSFRRWEWPLWNPYMYAGMPVFSNIQAASFYPPVLAAAALSALTGIRVDAFLEWDLVLHVFLAGVFMYWLLRNLSANRAAALAGAMIYSLGGFFAAQAEHLGAVSGAAWLPLAWWSVLRLRTGWNRAWFVALAGSFAMSILAGLPQVAVSVIASSALLGAALWTADRSRARDRKRGTDHSVPASKAVVPRPAPAVGSSPFHSRIGATGRVAIAIAGAALFAAMLAAVQLIPTIQMTWASIARYRADYMDTGGGVWPPSLLTLVLPDRYGVFDPAKYSGHGDLTFTYFYCGLIGVALAIFAVFRKGSAAFSMLTLACGLWMLGDSTWIGKEIFIHLPVSIRIGIHPEYMTFAFLAGVAVLAGLGAERLPRGSRSKGTWLGYAAVALIAADLIVTSSARPMNQVSRLAEPGVTSDAFDGSRELLLGVRKLSRSSGPPWRIDVNDRSLLEWAVESPLTQVPSADGHDPLALERIIQVRLAFAHGYRWGSSYPIENLRSPVIDLLNVRYVLSRNAIDPAELRGSSLELLATLPGHWVYENRNVLPRFFFVSKVRTVNDGAAAAEILHSPDFDPHREAIIENGDGKVPTEQDLAIGNVELRSYRANRIELIADSPGPSLLVASDANYPGWEALVDGRPAVMDYADVAFRGIPLAGGRHTVVMRLVPHILYWSAAVSLCAWFIAGWLIASVLEKGDRLLCPRL